MTTETTVFHLEGLNKDGAVALARHFGMRKDWARTRLPEILKLLKPYSPDRLLAAAKALPDYFDDEDIESLTDPEASFADDDDAVTEVAEAEAAEVIQQVAAEAKPAPAPAAKPAPAPAAQAPQDVGAVAQALAALLAAGGVNEQKVREIVAPEIMAARNDMADALESAVQHVLTATQRTIEAAVASIPPRELRVVTERSTVTIEGVQHKEFDTLLTCLAARTMDDLGLNVWLYGPPGTGKTTAARNAAKALDLPFYATGALMSKYDISGYMDANGKYVRSTFREAWENGGIFLFDEIDGSAPQAVVAFNAALANGVMAFPDGMVERNKDCVVIAGSNTINGATAEFTGRMKLDEATKDRWIFIEWSIDENVERAMCPQYPEWVSVVQKTRAAVAAKGIKVFITPRATLYGSALLDQGLPLEKVKTLVLRKGMSAEQWAAIQ